jgi:FSR family fosmidomycin resistance protein-like MFS transporter
VSALAQRLLPGAGVDRRAVASLTVGHLGADLFQGAVPALVPFLVRDRGLDYADAGLIVLAGSLASSFLQPLAGLVGDRLRAPWLPPLGLVLAAAGLAAGTAATGFAAIAAALMVGGLGVALFHPEAVRAARMASGPNPGSALAVFAVGGNLGFALGPALVVPLAAAFGLEAAGAVALVPLAAAALVVAAGRRRRDDATAPADGIPLGARNRRVFSFASMAATARTGFAFGLMAFIPSWFAVELGSSLALGSVAVAAMLIAGAGGTYLGGRLSDAFGRTRVILISLAAVVPLAAVLPFAPAVPAIALLVLIGVAMDANFYPLVIVAQDALPDRVGLASGVVIGVSVGVGAGCTAVLGALADAHGLDAALWGCLALAVLALACAAAGLHPGRARATVTVRRRVRVP